MHVAGRITRTGTKEERRLRKQKLDNRRRRDELRPKHQREHGPSYKKGRKGATVRAEVVFHPQSCYCLLAGLIIFLIGMVLCVIGYHAAEVAGLTPEEITAHNYNGSLPEVDDTRYIMHHHLMKLRYAGPVIMGVGFFVILCACVVQQNTRDPEGGLLGPKSERKHDIYDEALRRHLEELRRQRDKEERRRQGIYGITSANQMLCTISTCIIPEATTRSKPKALQNKQRVSPQYVQSPSVHTGTPSYYFPRHNRLVRNSVSNSMPSLKPQIYRQHHASETLFHNQRGCVAQKVISVRIEADSSSEGDASPLLELISGNDDVADTSDVSHEIENHTDRHGVSILRTMPIIIVNSCEAVPTYNVAPIITMPQDMLNNDEFSDLPV